MEVRLTAARTNLTEVLAHCKSCKKEKAKYSCPKCRIPYCSLPCYKEHSDQCVELFYQQNVLEHMKSTAGSEKDKSEMMKILQRMAQEAENEPEEKGDEVGSQVPWGDVLERLEKGEDVLASLPVSVRHDFERAIREGQLGNDLEVWEPWWTSVARITPIPITVPTLPSLSSLTHSASPLLAYGLVDLLYTYSIVLRLWHGDWKDDAPSAAAAALQLSAVLSSKQPHCSTLTAMLTVQERAVRFKLLPAALSIASMTDVLCLLARHDYSLAALADLHAMFTQVMRLGTNASVAREVTTQERKLFFHLVYLHEQPPAVLVPLATEAASVHSEQLKRSSVT